MLQFHTSELSLFYLFYFPHILLQQTLKEVLI